ncbi:hypothetical protein [Aneurinibacillus danicus]|uniref:Uncharacterized protein n=1 Tax=Aneurinibacillus danicus TaxID=267746 RepID=A0A511VDY6_9BACL|nr:hypothetical protein [Aneurinibacillus danicus]GEN35793.1 hypothetical protein ADA01nite_32530 [Aneurinibacillus danicus]
MKSKMTITVKVVGKPSEKAMKDFMNVLTSKIEDRYKEESINKAS